MGAHEDRIGLGLCPKDYALSIKGYAPLSKGHWPLGLV